MAKTKEEQKFELATLNPSQLQELSGWEQKQYEIVEQNPFVKVENTETYELAKQHRTALRTARTDLQKQDADIASVLTAFRKSVKAETNRLIEITQVHEERQQEEVKEWEAAIEQRRLEREQKEREAEEEQRRKIQEIGAHLQEFTDSMEYENMDAVEKEFEEACNHYDNDSELMLNPVWSVMLDTEIEDRRERFENRKRELKKEHEREVERRIYIEKNSLQALAKEASEIVYITEPEHRDTIKPRVDELFSGHRFEQLKTEFDDLIADTAIRVEKQVQKLEQDAQRIEQLKELEQLRQEKAKLEREKEQREIQERRAKIEAEARQRFESRAAILTDAGFKNEGTWFNLKVDGKNLGMFSHGEVRELSDADFEQQVKNVELSVKKIEQERKASKKLAPDKKKMTAALDKWFESFDPEVKLKNDAAKDLWMEITENVDDYRETLKSLVERL